MSDTQENAGSALEQAQSGLREGLEGARRVVARTRFLLGGDDNGVTEDGLAMGGQLDAASNSN